MKVNLQKMRYVYERFYIQYDQMEEIVERMVKYKWNWQGSLEEQEQLELDAIKKEMEEQLEQFRLLCLILEKSIYRYERMERSILRLQEDGNRGKVPMACGTISVEKLMEWFAGLSDRKDAE